MATKAVTFLREDNGDEALYKDLVKEAFAVQVGLHELLGALFVCFVVCLEGGVGVGRRVGRWVLEECRSVGGSPLTIHPDLSHTHARTDSLLSLPLSTKPFAGHGSGKLFCQAEDGTLNFDQAKALDPATGQPVTGFYKARGLSFLVLCVFLCGLVVNAIRYASNAASLTIHLTPLHIQPKPQPNSPGRRGTPSSRSSAPLTRSAARSASASTSARSPRSWSSSGTRVRVWVCGWVEWDAHFVCAHTLTATTTITVTKRQARRPTTSRTSTGSTCAGRACWPWSSTPPRRRGAEDLAFAWFYCCRLWC